MVKKIFWTAAAALALAACAKTEVSSLSTEPNLVRRVLIASVDSEEQEAVKTVLSDHKISWSAGDRIGVVGSDGLQYEFTTATGGSENVEFVGEMPDGVDMWYSYSPYNASATLSWTSSDRTVYTTIPVFQNGKFGNGLILSANSRMSGKDGFQFIVHSSVWRLSVPSEWNVEELIMIGDEGDNHQPLAGDGYRLNFYGDSGKERLASAGAMEYMVSVSNPDGGTLSGETYIFTRHCPVTAAPKYTLVLRTSDKKVAFLRFDGSKEQTVNSGKIYDIKLPASISKWYDCEVATIDFADGTKQWWNFSSPTTGMLDGSASPSSSWKKLLSNRPFDLEFKSGKGDDYLFRVYSPLYTVRSQYHGLRTGCDADNAAYYEFPTLDGMAPAIVDARFGSTSGNAFHNGKPCIVYEDGGTEKSLLDTISRTGSTAMEANIRTKVWNFITANPTTVKGRTYKMKTTNSNNEMALRSLRVIYAGTDGPRAENVLTKDAAVYYEGTAGTKAVTLNGAFRMHGSGDFVCGFEYKLDDGIDSWHDLPCDTAAETFSVRTTAFENGKRYIYRAYAGLSGGTRFYGIERPVMFFAMDLADQDEYLSYFGKTATISSFPVEVSFGNYTLSLGYGGNETIGNISYSPTNGFVMMHGDYPYYKLPAVPGMRITGLYVWSVTSGSRPYLLNTEPPSDSGAAIGTTVMDSWTATTKQLSSKTLSIDSSTGVSYYMINPQKTKGNAQYLYLLGFRYE